MIDVGGIGGGAHFLGQDIDNIVLPNNIGEVDGEDIQVVGDGDAGEEPAGVAKRQRLILELMEFRRQQQE